MRRGGLFLAQAALAVVFVVALVLTSWPSYGATTTPGAAAGSSSWAASQSRASEVFANQAWQQARKAMWQARRNGEPHRSIGYLPRLRKSLSAPVRESLVDLTARGNKNHIDLDMQIGFRAGPPLTQSCLDLRTGEITTGPCSKQAAPAPADVSRAYGLIYRTLTWYDQRAGTFGFTARSVPLLDRAVNVEFPGIFEATYSDADADDLVDDGSVRLVAVQTGQCVQVTLPDHDPEGRTYGSYLERCPA